VIVDNSKLRCRSDYRSLRHELNHNSLILLHNRRRDGWYGRARDLERPSAWLDGVPDNTAVSGVFVRIIRVQTHLLAMVMAEGEIDGLHACRVLQHVAHDVKSEGWSTPVLRLAAQLGVELPVGPRSLTHMAGLEDLPANAYPIRIPRAALGDSNYRGAGNHRQNAITKRADNICA